MTTRLSDKKYSLSRFEKSLSILRHSLLPKQRAGLTCQIEMVASKNYGNRPWKRFSADQVFMNVNTGELEFRCKVVDVGDFIWNIVFAHDRPQGEYVDIYVDMLQEKRKVAYAQFRGTIVTANNLGDGHYVIRVKAESDVKVVNV